MAQYHKNWMSVQMQAAEQREFQASLSNLEKRVIEMQQETIRNMG